MRSRYDEDRDELTNRELQVGRLVAHGLTNLQIAEALDVSEKWVETCVSSALSKFGLRCRAELAAYMVEHRHVSVRGAPRDKQRKKAGWPVDTEV